MESKWQINYWLLASGALAFVTTAVHVLAGGPEVLDPVRESALDPVVISVVSVIWHAITLFLSLTGCVLLRAAFRSDAGQVHLVSLLQVGFAGLFVYYGLTDLGTLWLMPQWTIFLLIPLVSEIGLRRNALA